VGRAFVQRGRNSIAHSGMTPPRGCQASAWPTSGRLLCCQTRVRLCPSMLATGGHHSIQDSRAHHSIILLMLYSLEHPPRWVSKLGIYIVMLEHPTGPARERSGKRVSSCIVAVAPISPRPLRWGGSLRLGTTPSSPRSQLWRKTVGPPPSSSNWAAGTSLGQDSCERGLADLRAGHGRLRCLRAFRQI
jgi:hypothetical protein